MHTIILTLHVLMGFALIIIVLLQTGKGASIGSAFGGASQTLFGPRGATTFLHKLTTVAAIVFMVTSLTLAMSSSRKEVKSLMRGKAGQTETTKELPPQKLPPARGGEAPVTQ